MASRYRQAISGLAGSLPTLDLFSALSTFIPPIRAFPFDHLPNSRLSNSTQALALTLYDSRTSPPKGTTCNGRRHCEPVRNSSTSLNPIPPSEHVEKAKLPFIEVRFLSSQDIGGTSRLHPIK